MSKINIELTQDELNCVVSCLESLKIYDELVDSSIWSIDQEMFKTDFVDVDYLIIKLKSV